MGVCLTLSVLLGGLGDPFGETLFERLLVPCQGRLGIRMLCMALALVGTRSADVLLSPGPQEASASPPWQTKTRRFQRVLRWAVLGSNQ